MEKNKCSDEERYEGKGMEEGTEGSVAKQKFWKHIEYCFKLA